MRNIDSLKNSGEFRRVYSKRNSLSDRYLVIYTAEGSGKIGIVCSKKVGNSIVRHRITRLIREAYRLNKEHIDQNKDIIIVAREKAKDRGYSEIAESFIHLLKRHAVYH